MLPVYARSSAAPAQAPLTLDADDLGSPIRDRL